MNNVNFDQADDLTTNAARNIKFNYWPTTHKATYREGNIIGHSDSVQGEQNFKKHPKNPRQ